MTKYELIEEVAFQCKTEPKVVKNVLETALETIQRELAKGDSVAILGFGTFSVKYRAERVGQNPRTAEDIIIPAHKSPHFKAGKSLKQAVNND